MRKFNRGRGRAASSAQSTRRAGWVLDPDPDLTEELRREAQEAQPEPAAPDQSGPEPVSGGVSADLGTVSGAVSGAPAAVSAGRGTVSERFRAARNAVSAAGNADQRAPEAENPGENRRFNWNESIGQGRRFILNHRGAAAATAVFLVTGIVSGDWCKIVGFSAASGLLWVNANSKIICRRSRYMIAGALAAEAAARFGFLPGWGRVIFVAGGIAAAVAGVAFNHNWRVLDYSVDTPIVNRAVSQIFHKTDCSAAAAWAEHGCAETGAAARQCGFEVLESMVETLGKAGYYAGWNGAAAAHDKDCDLIEAQYTDILKERNSAQKSIIKALRPVVDAGNSNKAISANIRQEAGGNQAHNYCKALTLELLRLYREQEEELQEAREEARQARQARREAAAELVTTEREAAQIANSLREQLAAARQELKRLQLTAGARAAEDQERRSPAAGQLPAALGNVIQFKQPAAVPDQSAGQEPAPVEAVPEAAAVAPEKLPRMLWVYVLSGFSWGEAAARCGVSKGKAYKAAHKWAEENPEEYAALEAAAAQSAQSAGGEEAAAQ